MTFIMDRVFRHFGLHGQSLFPLVLGGVFVGGCAIPGVMATRGIKDERARLATILVVPLMNCAAKTPLYLLLIGIFFVQYQGFNWRVNIALISSFAAKESSVATLGSIYKSDEGASLEQKVTEQETGWTPLHALAIMLFMALYPPCIPTLLAVRLETGSTKWMLFATFYPIILGSIIAVLIFSGGSLLGLTGIQAVIWFYVLAIIVILFS